MNKELIAKLKNLAARKCWFDDEDASPYESDDNSDDIYQNGCETGQTELAREILKEISNE